VHETLKGGRVGQKLLWLALAGALGTMSRYLLAGLAQRLAGTSFPWGTLVVNSLGCLVFGIIWALASERFAMGTEIRTIVLVGFLGAFTTFSSAIAEFGQMTLDAEWMRAMLYLIGGNALGIGTFFVGSAIGRIV
jgi:fluoride exporter